ncbi:MAG: SMI1/KNR4 family protein [Pseudomonadota bacterium]
MFSIPPATLSFWARLDIKPASDGEIAQIAALAPGPLPDDYVSFLKTYGFARWMLTVPDRFRYRKTSGGQEIVKAAAVAHLENPESIERAMKHAWSQQPELGLPCWPQGVLPIAGNAGPGQVLMDVTGSVGAIRYWEPSEDVWGSGANTDLWDVAPDFTSFIAGLVMRDQL